MLQAEKNKYNKQHLVVQTRNYNSKNDLLSTVKRKYNENNDCISLEAHIKTPKKEKNIVTYSYVYDAHVEGWYFQCVAVHLFAFLLAGEEVV